LGREAIVELLDIDDRVREIIYEGTMTQLHRYLRDIKFISFGAAAREKVTTGVTTVEEVLRVLPRSAFARHSSTDKIYTDIPQLPLPPPVPPTKGEDQDEFLLTGANGGGYKS
jgi:hypothetical protein